MRVSNLLSFCFRPPSDAESVASPTKYPIVVNASGQVCGAALVAGASFQPRASQDEEPCYPANRNITYTPNEIAKKTSFCVELRRPSIQPQQRSKVEYTTADELVKDVQDLRWLGQGAQGVVYEGIWQGATVAVKFSIVDDLDATAYELLFSRLLSHPNVVQTFVAKVAVLDEKTIHPPNDGSCHGASRGPNQRCSTGCDLRVRPCNAAVASALHGPIGPPGGGAAAAAAASKADGSGGAAGIDDVHGVNVSGRTLQAPPPTAVMQHSKSGKAGDPAGSGGARAVVDAGSCRDSKKMMQLAPAGRVDSFQSDDGFGDPFGRRRTFTDVREVLATMGAKPGHYITQMVMEHCDHGSLHAAIQRGIFKPTSRWGPKLALRALIRTVREVAQGMFHLHSNNVLHGDLKPANVLLINSRKDRRGYIAKVSDFGMAQFCSQDHISNSPWGTLVYMAPERLLHGQLFAASDVFSFGVMMWEMYHGQRPYDGMHAAQIVMACAQGVVSLEWSPDAFEDVVRISRSCLAPSPRDRPTFERLMRELALLEARVRLEGPRTSTSVEMSRQSTRASTDATTPLRRAGASNINPRSSIDLAVSGAPPSSRRGSQDRSAASKARRSSDTSRTSVSYQQQQQQHQQQHQQYQQQHQQQYQQQQQKQQQHQQQHHSGQPRESLSRTAPS